ncbi:hypothetical protein LWC34_30015 [Kibdelosporangium philippinense]|uniref:Transposase IS4-like domain-containing protein n=1 Tax=Kibdelosporangium philippinense TaxID=211113 RepID=A0ABS8ZGT6_9PSEU|nr:hypothetical protein [Kibdelosporangium philippinense]MCE7007035.1 hypothetical protein [Kibdelosporangium philippinense]
MTMRSPLECRGRAWRSCHRTTPRRGSATNPARSNGSGYKDHQTEICDEEQPNLIVHVVTTPAPEQDIGVVGGIHAALAEQQLAPAEHLVDSGYVTPETVHHAATDHGITIVGPVRQDPRARERPGFAKEDFHIDWQAETVTCPQGIVSPPWKHTMARRTLCWSLGPEVPGEIEPYAVMGLMFEKFTIMDYTHGTLSHRYPVADTLALTAEMLRGATSVERIDLLDQPDLFVFTVGRDARSDLLVGWRCGNGLTDEDKPPTELERASRRNPSTPTANR